MFRIFHNYLEEKDSPRRRAFGRKDQDQRSEPQRHGEEHFEEKIKVKDLNHGETESTEKSIKM